MKKDKDQNKGKEDHLSPTKIENGKDERKNTVAPDLSHEELDERLDLYSKVGGGERQFFDIQKIKRKYGLQVEKNKENRAKTDIYYAQGKRNGLPHAPYEQIKDMREQSDQKFRDDIAGEAKESYRANNSLTKTFEGQKSLKESLREIFRRQKDKENDREK